MAGPWRLCGASFLQAGVTLWVALWAALGTAAAYAASSETSSRPQIIEYYGDSTIWGFKSNSGEQVAKPAPAVFAESLSSYRRFDVRNEGVNSSTACSLLQGTDGKHVPWPAQMAASPARYVLINFAINDQWKYDAPTYKTCLQSLARIARQHGKKVIFETPNPTRDTGSDGLDRYVKAMKEVANEERIPVIDQYRYLLGFLGGQSPYAICPDGLHPTEQVYAMKGQYAARMFLQYFPARPSQQN